MDARRFANKQGLTLMGPKKIYFARPINAGMLYAQQHGVFRAYNDLAFDRFWRRDLDPESVEAVSAALEQVGAPQGFAAFLDGDGGARHDALRTEAEASGIFGVPSFVLDGEIFWGGDRVFLLRERLDEKGVPRRR
jgi:2-hydroxychromene-2-carboxylate isomerase